MDPFEVRMQFLSLLSRLTSSLASIQKLSSFALKHGPRCGDDIWDCLVEECQTASLNARVNLLYFLDTLIGTDTKLGQAEDQPYRRLVTRDLAKVVDLVVPKTREGNMNLMSANQVLRSWKTRRLLDADLIDAISADLEGRRASLHTTTSEESSISQFSKNDILRRIEDDRERHKRLRERIWVLPVPSTLLPTTLTSSTSTSSPSPAPQPPTSNSGTSSTKTSPASPASPSETAETFLLPTKMRAKVKAAAATSSSTSTSTSISSTTPAKPPPATVIKSGGGPELAIEIEFDQLWEGSEDEWRLSGSWKGDEEEKWELGEEERMAMKLETDTCFLVN